GCGSRCFGSLTRAPTQQQEPQPMFRVSPFASLLKLLPRGLFDRLVEQHGADRYRKRFSCWQQLVAMVYAQLSGASSLRVLESSFNAHSAHHYHLGCRGLKRSTLADMNASGSLEVFTKLAEALMRHASREDAQRGR